jgi:hypothetical protein
MEEFSTKFTPLPQEKLDIFLVTVVPGPVPAEHENNAAL